MIMRTFAAVGVAAILGSVMIGLAKVPPPPALTQVQQWNGSSNDLFGSHVAGVNDLDGDSVPDVLIGACDFDGTPSNARSGVVYAYSGATGNSLPGDFSGYNTGEHKSVVISPGDVNGDGKPDIVIGAPGFDGNRGRIYVYSGANSNLIRSIDGETAGDLYGMALSPAGDCDHDGKRDFLVGAPSFDTSTLADAGKVYLVSGANGNTIRAWAGDGAGDLFGSAVAGDGDTNGDGIPDAVIGAPLNDGGGLTNRGKVYVCGTGFPPPPPVVILGTQDHGLFGFSIALVDSNVDGRSEILVGEPRYRNPSNQSCTGRVFVYNYANNGYVYNRIFAGESNGDLFGSAIAKTGDMNVDGRPDIVIGAPQYDSSNGPDSGRVYAYSPLTGTLIGQADGLTANEGLGHAVASPGDITGDGKAELLVGAWYRFVGTNLYAGSAVLFSPP